MKNLDQTQVEVSAILGEVEQLHRDLALPIEPEDFEAWVIVNRVEKRLRHKMGKDAAP